MHVLVVLSRKGGVGKSTIARSIAVQALLEDRKSAILDADVQGTSVYWGNRRSETAPAVIPIDGKSVEAHLADLKKKGADFVIIDTPPSVHPVINAAVMAGDANLIVTEALPESLEQVGAMVDIVKRFDKPRGIVITRVPTRSSALTMAKSVLTAFKVPVCPTPMTTLVVHPYSAAEGLSAQEYAPSSKAAIEIKDIWNWLSKNGIV